MLAAYVALTILIFAEALITVIRAFRFGRFFQNRAATPVETLREWPRVALIAPCKGMDENLAGNIESWRRLDYPNHKLFFVLESEQDPASDLVKSISESEVFISGKAFDCGQKIHNLRYAISKLSKEYEAFAFVDSDGRLPQDWLKRLVSVLLQHPEDAATGYRWFLPAGKGFAAHLRSVWNSSVLTLFEESGTKNFAWGGSMALRCKTFFDTDVPGYWNGSISDDYALTNAMHASGRKVHFVPQAIAVTSDRVSLGEFFSWAGRQLLITRVYFPRLWRSAFAYHAAWFAWLVWGILCHPQIFLVAFLGAQLLQGIKAEIRLRCMRAVLGSDSAGNSAIHWCLSPLIGLANFAMLMGNVLTRTVRWRGIEYVLLGKNKLQIHHQATKAPGP